MSTNQLFFFVKRLWQICCVAFSAKGSLRQKWNQRNYTNKNIFSNYNNWNRNCASDVIYIDPYLFLISYYHVFLNLKKILNNLKRSWQNISALDHQCLPSGSGHGGLTHDEKFISTLHKNYSFVQCLQNCVEWYGPFGPWHPSFKEVPFHIKTTIGWSN